MRILQAGGRQPRYDFSFRSPRQKYVKSGLVAEATELEKMLLATPCNEFMPQPGSYTLNFQNCKNSFSQGWLKRPRPFSLLSLD